MIPPEFSVRKFYFPLYAKILFWFFVNLAALAIVFYVFVAEQFRVGLDSLLLGPAGDKLEAAARAIADELAETTRGQWNVVLTNHAKSGAVQFVLFDPAGRQLAGETSVLPPEVLEKMRNQPGPQFRPSQGAPPSFDRPPPDGPPLGEPPQEGPPQEGRPPDPSRRFPKFMVRSTGPTRYWVGIRFPIRTADRPRPVPGVLLAVSNSLGGGGLFIDFTPWLLVGGGGIALSVLLWFPVVRGITRALSQITAATERIAEGDFDVEIPARRADELGRLANAVNRLSGRLGGFVTGQKRFLGDIAHELCSPLARAEMALGVLEQKTGPSHRVAVEDVREEVRLISNLVNELLSFSKAGLKAKDLVLTPVPLHALLEKVVAREAGESDDVRMEISEDITAKADPELLARALSNLLRNALRYAARCCPVTIRGAAAGENVILTVTDMGPGVPEEALSKLGEPFFRPEAARTREGGGAGLGLAIVRACVEACRGTLTLRNLQPKGFEAGIRLER